MTARETTKTSNRQKKKAAQVLSQQRTFFVRFPFHEELSHFEEEVFSDIIMAKKFIEETGVVAACIVNGVGSTVTSYLVDQWVSYN